MEARALLDALRVAERLKDATRHCYTSGGRHESVAEHSWRLALMAYWLRDEFPEADMDKVLRMCLIHDLGEAFTGDIPTFVKTDADRSVEDSLLDTWVASLPAPYAEEMRALYREMNERQSLEARIFKALDGLEALIQHNESDIKTWSENEYDLNLRYCDDRVGFSPALSALREAIRADTVAKIAAERQRAQEDSVFPFLIKPMESEEEIRGKAYVHWKSWQESYQGIVDPTYLSRLTLEKCEEIAFRYPENILIAKDGERVVGFSAAGAYRSPDGSDAEEGEVYALYVRKDYQNRGIGRALMRESLAQLSRCKVFHIWVLKENRHAIHFYRRVGFRPDGEEKELILGTAVTCIRMSLTLTDEKENATCSV